MDEDSGAGMGLDGIVIQWRGKVWQKMQLFVIPIGMWLGWGLGMTRTGTRRLGRMRTKTGRLGTGDNKENEIVLENVKDITWRRKKRKMATGELNPLIYITPSSLQETKQ
jgi:hypothetical protein